MRCTLALLGLEQVQVLTVPTAQAVGYQHRKHRKQAEPDHITLAERNDDRRRQQRPQCGTGIASDLKGRLRQTKTPARG
ncbi:hypothetical protein D3C79_744270 [compost metagenome]